ncbi:MAG: hypothetical protein PVI00_02395, partial [Desulfobacterales bacterium]
DTYINGLIYSPDVAVSIKGAMKIHDRDRICTSPTGLLSKIHFNASDFWYFMPGVHKRSLTG